MPLKVITKFIFMGIILLVFGLFLLINNPNSLLQEDKTQFKLLPNHKELVSLGKDVYAQQCAACHGANLEGQANWRQRDNKGYMPAPPHDANGHTWHHPDEYLFSVTKYGIEETLGREYPNNMPAYKTLLTDKQIVAVLSYIKSTWPERIQYQHDQINIRAKNQ
ncbi:MAG TPA: cytochrome C [Oceanospirillaceae bacterium]|nr:cytochrome C [Oceanospirillaceae bacterium]